MPSEQQKVLARARRKKRGRRIARIAGWTGGILAFAVIAAAIALRFPEAQISTIAVSGARAVSAAAIEEIIKSELAGAYALVFPKNNIFLAPRHAIERRLVAEFPRIAGVEANTEGLSIFSVSVREHDPAFVWCGEGVPASGKRPADTPCFFMNGEGLIFAEAPLLSQGIYFELYGAPEHHSEDGGIVRSVMFSSGEALAQIALWREGFARVGFESVGVAIIAPDRYEMIVRLANISDTLPRIIWNPAHDQAALLEALGSALELKKKERPENMFSKLSYIDLRFPGQVVFKFE